MNTTATSRTAASAVARTDATATRVDLYAGIHKALRHFMTDTLHRVGRMDVADADDMTRTMGQLDALLEECLHHLQRENAFMHTAMEARQPRGSSRTADDHVEHEEGIEDLQAEANALRAAAQGERAGLALRLYRHLALFIADNFQHMHHEETHNNAVMWAHYSDAEIIALHHRLLASIPPQENLQVGRWMIPALNPAERAMVFMDMKSNAPAPAFAAMLDVVRPHLDDTAWNKLARALGVPQAPGLVDCI
jgi:hypothetical protein